MTDIIISNKPWNEYNLKKHNKWLDVSYGNHKILWPYKPYSIGKMTAKDEHITRVLQNNGNMRNLHQLCTAIGQDNIVPVSESITMLHDSLAAGAGSTASVYGARSNAFVASVQHYQKVLLNYRDVMQTEGSTTAIASSAGIAVKTAFEKMQKKFQFELKTIAKGTPLNNSTRAMNIARDSRNVKSLHLTSRAQAGKLARFSNKAKVLGGGLIVIDIASRLGNVHNKYKADGNWEKELFVESTSFGLSLVAGSLTVKAGAAALGFITVATPVGWVALIVVAAGASMIANHEAKKISASWYDDIVDWANSL